ncbi:MAG TPA: glycosyltransferase [Solirubrobacterales bacterium]|nr:glycosyltransferase [Solirubrobacterales bacterium]
MPIERPRCLRELSVWLAGSDELAASLRTVCEVNVLHPADWHERLQDAHASFLLVEGNNAAEARWETELDRLLEACEGAGIPRLLWFTSSPTGPRLLARCGRFDQVLAAERWQVPELEAAKAAEPTTLWPATALPIDGAAGDRSDPVVWLGGWSRDWPADWQERLASVLRGASQRGLRIVPVADLDGLPGDLQECVDTGEPRDPRAAMRRAKVVIGADPVVGSSTFVPAVVFDAAACGAAVLTPHDFVTIHEMAVGKVAEGTWRNMVPIVHDGEITVEELDRLLDDEQYRIEVVGHMGRIVANNHTYAHRVATLASAARYSVVYDAVEPVAV